MDYEQKYNDAMARLEFVVRTGMKLDPVYIFPELAKSEDERIRKEIRDFLIDMECKEEWITYLEKQKEKFEDISIVLLVKKEIERRIETWQKSRQEALAMECNTLADDAAVRIEELNSLISFLGTIRCSTNEKQKEQKPVMIQWTGKNLKEVIDFTGKSPKFGEWFKSWEDFENYVHSHDDILKLFCEDGSHYEVPVGAWVVKTPDGYNIPSRFRFIQKPAEWSEEDEDMFVSVLHFLNTNRINERGKVITWVESLPKRFSLQPKQEWSEEDESPF